MLASLIIVFREVLEAGLVIGIVLAATQGVAGRAKWVALGVGAGIVGSCVVAAFADVISAQFQDSGQELFNATVLLTAVVMLGWHNVWMAKHGKELAQEMKSLGRDVSRGDRSLAALSLVIGLAVLREGSEVVLFLTGILASEKGGIATVAVGGAGGMALGAVVATLLYAGLLQIPARHLFSVTTWLITLLAAGMAAQAVLFLNQAGMLLVGGDIVWDSSGLLSEDSMVGRMLHIMVGYNDRPTELQLAVYVAVVATIVLLTRWTRALSDSRRVATAR